MDAVIVWTDTEKKGYRSIKLKYLKEENIIPSIVHERSIYELLIMISTICRNCSDIIDRIIVVCEDEDCRIESFLSINSSLPSLPIETVKHTELFKGFDGFLPSYSPIAIRTLLYRLKKLSEEFILFDFSCIPIKSMSKDELVSKCDKKRKWPWMKKPQMSIFPPVLITKKQMEEKISSTPGLLAKNLRQRFDSPCQEELILRKLEYMDRADEICQILPTESDEEFILNLFDATKSKMIAMPPLSQFSKEQALCLYDWFCSVLKIQLAF